MTIMTTRTWTKKAFKEAIAASDCRIYFEDPSIFSPRCSGNMFSQMDMEIGESFACVLDHPRRAVFATIKRTAEDKFIVS